MDRNPVIPHSPPVIEARGLGRVVSVSGNAQPLTILDAVSFAVGEGETVAIVGASGSGKSTLLGLLAGLDTPSSGDVLIRGQSLAALDEDARAALRGEQVGFVFQSFQLLPALSALENVMLPLELAGVSRAEATARDWLERVGLGGRVAHYPRQLSGGEQQRVALARAFATEPSLLLADEPTGNLDATTGAAIIELLFSLNRERGATLLLVTHDEELAARCDRQLRMHAGTLGEAEAVLRSASAGL
ncbi:MAG: ABC transporter ATP-binding protein [Rhodocyclaceae bacterium]|nr:ABC transporter ATP-binding protein [Rhodocyclaceae bacterium]